MVRQCRRHPSIVATRCTETGQGKRNERAVLCKWELFYHCQSTGGLCRFRGCHYYHPGPPLPDLINCWTITLQNRGTGDLLLFSSSLFQIVLKIISEIV